MGNPFLPKFGNKQFFEEPPAECRRRQNESRTQLLLHDNRPLHVIPMPIYRSGNCNVLSGLCRFSVPPSVGVSIMAGPPAMSTCAFLLLLLLGGDIETNPGPKKGAKEDKGPTVDDKIRDLGAMINQYEEKVQGKTATRPCFSSLL